MSVATKLEPPLNTDPAAYVQAAEDITNAADGEAAGSVYAPNAVLELIADGAAERHEGLAAIRTAQQGYMAGLRAAGFRLTKQLTSATDDTIVNEWTGTLGGRTEAKGIEVWRFDDEGLVIHHRLYNFLAVKPSTSTVARLRVMLGYPLSALKMLRAQRRAQAAA